MLEIAYVAAAQVPLAFVDDEHQLRRTDQVDRGRRVDRAARGTPGMLPSAQTTVVRYWKPAARRSCSQSQASASCWPRAVSTGTLSASRPFGCRTRYSSAAQVAAASASTRAPTSPPESARTSTPGSTCLRRRGRGSVILNTYQQQGQRYDTTGSRCSTLPIQAGPSWAVQEVFQKDQCVS